MPTIRSMIKNYLLDLGYTQIVEKEDAKHAVTALVEARGKAEQKFGLIISDWNMPEMTGIDFLKFVRSEEEFKHTPFILVTTESEKDQVTEAVFAGVSQYIVKPFSQKVFLEKLQSTFNKHASSQKN